MKLNRKDIPSDFPVRPLGPDDPAEDRATCGECGLSWDDAIPTTYTPAPAARCPFETFHETPEEPEDDPRTPEEHRAALSVMAYGTPEPPPEDRLREIGKAILAEADRTGGRERTVSRYEIDRLRAALAEPDASPRSEPGTPASNQRGKVDADGFASIGHIHRGDLEALGFNPDEITDELLVQIAEEVGEMLTSHAWEDALADIAERHLDREEGDEG